MDFPIKKWFSIAMLNYQRVSFSYQLSNPAVSKPFQAPLPSAPRHRCRRSLCRWAGNTRRRSWEDARPWGCWPPASPGELGVRAKCEMGNDWIIHDRYDRKNTLIIFNRLKLYQQSLLWVDIIYIRWYRDMLWLKTCCWSWKIGFYVHFIQFWT